MKLDSSYNCPFLTHVNSQFVQLVCAWHIFTSLNFRNPQIQLHEIIKSYVVHELLLSFKSV